MNAMWIGLALAVGGAVVIGLVAEGLRRRLRRGKSDHSSPQSLWARLFRSPRA
jgi:hypothetical protein